MDLVLRPNVEYAAAYLDDVIIVTTSSAEKRVRAFLGIAGYDRRFIPAFTELTSPLTDRTRKGTPDLVQWAELCQVAFEKGSLWGAAFIYT